MPYPTRCPQCGYYVTKLAGEVLCFTCKYSIPVVATFEEETTMKSPVINRWQVTGTSGRTYTVSQHQDGHFGCDCAAWRFQRNGRKDCQHILAKKMELMESNAIPTFKLPSLAQAAAAQAQPAASPAGRKYRTE